MKNSLIGIAVLAAIALGASAFFSGEPIPTVQALTTEQNGMKASLSLRSEEVRAGEPVTMTFTITDAEGNPVTDLMEHHARRVHTLIIGEDLSSIGHIHPSDFGLDTDEAVARGEQAVEYTFPAAGRYIVGVDVMRMSGETLAAQFLVNVEGSPKQGDVPSDFSRQKQFSAYAEQGHDRYVEPVLLSQNKSSQEDGYEVTFTTSPEEIRAGEEVELGFRIERNGEPVVDLEPYLDAALHLAIVPQSLSQLIHSHGFADDRADAMAMEEGHEEGEHGTEAGHATEEEDHGHVHMSHLPEAFGPKVASESIVFPEAGVYQVFGQVKHEGKIIVMDFLVDVAEPIDPEAAQVFDLSIEERALTPALVEVNQGDDVILRVSTDEPGDFHITGYEIEKTMVSDGILEIAFRANIAGRFNLELHPGMGGHGHGEGHEGGAMEDIEIGTLVVQPR